MPAVRLDRVVVNVPVPVPSVVLESEIVGLALVPQHNPFAVTVAPPSKDTFPPPLTTVGETVETAAVETVAIAGVENTTSNP